MLKDRKSNITKVYITHIERLASSARKLTIAYKHFHTLRFWFKSLPL